MTKRILLSVVFSSMAAGGLLAADVSSLIYFDYTHDATEGGTSDGAFNFVRSYLTVTDKPADNLAYRVQFDAGQLKSYTLASGSTTRTDSDGDVVDVNTYSLSSADAGFYLYVKNACVDWSTDWGTWTLGVQPTNLNYTQDATFGNRFVDLPLMDTHGFVSSADLGVRWGKDFGLLKASAMVANGGGYKKSETDRFKKYSVNLSAGEQALAKKDGWNAGVAYSLEPFQAVEVEDRTVLGVFGGWAGMGARLGLEYDTKTTTGATDLVQTILGVTANYKLPVAGLEAFFRLDLYDPNTDDVADNAGTPLDESKNNETTILAGVKLSPVKGLVIAPNLRLTSYEDSDRDALTYYRVNFEFKI
ncbi:MAG: hypothetical protein WC326_03235 [Candidatus Delongbacteria bacterium]